MEATASHSTFEGIVTLVVGLSWPLVTSVALIYLRIELRSAAKVLVKKLSSAETMKIGPIEIAELAASAEAKTKKELAVNPLPRGVPEQQVKTSQALNAELNALGLDKNGKTAFASLRLTKLSLDYDMLRREMPTSSDERTRRMNEIVSLMRTFALPGFGLLKRLTGSTSPGDRLAALAILQVRSSSRYLSWLRERFSSEHQPFLLFHTALVLKRMTQFQRFREGSGLSSAIEYAIRTTEGYKGGTPDADTLIVLRDARDVLSRSLA